MIQGVYTLFPLPFQLNDIPSREEPSHVLLCSPDYFEIVDEKNVHMQGQVGNTDKEQVFRQWSALRTAYESLQEKGVLADVSWLQGAEGCEDMVFCANQSFPWKKQNGEKVVVMSKMRHPSRQHEVQYFEQFFKSRGFRPVHFEADVTFEGMGDVIPHPHRSLLYGGYGHRTMPSAYFELSDMLDTPVIALELVSPKFYHLDTCFVPLSETSVMLCREAFSNEGLELIGQMFETVYSVPETEAESLFSLNAHVLHLQDRKIALLQQGSKHTADILRKEGFEMLELDTSEFMKSGGSVFCMKIMYP